MDSNLHSIVIAQQIQDRLAEATSARLVREAKRGRAPEPRLRPVWLRLRREAVAETGEEYVPRPA